MAPGGTFPDYELTDHTNTRRKLSALQGNDPMIVVLSRGHYCPKDYKQHLELVEAYSQIAVAYTQIVTISTDDILETREFRDSVGAQWTFLSDAVRKVQKDLEIQEYTDSHHDPMIPHTLVLKPGLVIHSVYNGYWFWGRPSFEDLRRDLREVTREIRPDWDLAAPGLREAWQTGDRSAFYPDPVDCHQPAEPLRDRSLVACALAGLVYQTAYAFRSTPPFATSTVPAAQSWIWFTQR
ncbi:MAG: redoxin domain-containing protein [Chloroflexi bacterium]|nr:MAG: redoxin domain-containing protein [Chloroflexota bacterium]